MGVQSLLAGIVVNTGLYSVNLMLTGNKAQLSLSKVPTVFTIAKDALQDTFLKGQYRLEILPQPAKTCCSMTASRIS